eukprot:Sspe_Gene.80400::Locus_50748_Transcript_1_1_Confidence_1.000_Length_535::g.80400::m.80400
MYAVGAVLVVLAWGMTGGEAGVALSPQCRFQPLNCTGGELCCENKWTKKAACFDPKTASCCGGAQGDGVLCDVTNSRCCGEICCSKQNECYRDLDHVERCIPKCGHCTAGLRCCGGRCMNTTQHVCCNNRVCSGNKCCGGFPGAARCC